MNRVKSYEFCRRCEKVAKRGQPAVSLIFANEDLLQSVIVGDCSVDIDNLDCLIKQLINFRIAVGHPVEGSVDTPCVKDRRLVGIGTQSPTGNGCLKCVRSIQIIIVEDIGWERTRCCLESLFCQCFLNQSDVGNSAQIPRISGNLKAHGECLAVGVCLAPDRAVCNLATLGLLDRPARRFHQIDCDGRVIIWMKICQGWIPVPAQGMGRTVRQSRRRLSYCQQPISIDGMADCLPYSRIFKERISQVPVEVVIHKPSVGQIVHRPIFCSIENLQILILTE